MRRVVLALLVGAGFAWQLAPMQAGRRTTMATTADANNVRASGRVFAAA
jgi:hypothetical protein